MSSATAGATSPTAGSSPTSWLLVCSVAMCLARNMTPPSWPVSLYGALCIIEILAVRLKIVLIDPFDADGMVRPHCTITGIQRSIVCPLFNNLEMMLWFACLMTFLMGAGHGRGALVPAHRLGERVRVPHLRPRPRDGAA